MDFAQVNSDLRFEQWDGLELKELHHSNEFQNSGYECAVGVK